MIDDTTGQDPAARPLRSSFDRYLQDKGKARGGEGGNYRRNAARKLERFVEWPAGERGDEDRTGNAATCGSYDHRERREVHYRWPEGPPVKEVLHEQLRDPAEAVAPDGGRTGRSRPAGRRRKRKVQDDLEPRTKRAIDEAMHVPLLSKVGRYEV